MLDASVSFDPKWKVDRHMRVKDDAIDGGRRHRCCQRSRARDRRHDDRQFFDPFDDGLNSVDTVARETTAKDNTQDWRQVRLP